MQRVRPLAVVYTLENTALTQCEYFGGVSENVTTYQ